MGKQRQRRFFTAAESAQIWDRWQRGEGLKLIGRVFGKTSSNFTVAGYSGETVKGCVAASHQRLPRKTVRMSGVWSVRWERTTPFLRPEYRGTARLRPVTGRSRAGLVD